MPTQKLDHSEVVLIIQSCRFKRSQHSPEERGVIFNYGDGAIIDMMGNFVPPPIWTWDPSPNFLITYK